MSRNGKGDGGSGPPSPDSALLPDAQLGDQGAITFHVLLLEVIQEAAALTDHFQQAPVGVLILGVGAHMLGEDVDALGENSDLDLGGPGIALMGTVGVDDFGFLLFTKHSDFPPFQILPPRDCAPGR